MNVYLDTSVVLRRVLQQPNSLDSWGDWDAAFASVLLKIEYLRAVDQLRLEGYLSDDQRVLLHQELDRIQGTLHTVPLHDEIVTRAAQPFGTVLGTLDALHLATAMLLRERVGPQFVIVTHDRQLARAAQSSGFEVQGV
jgi:predicted nucleic acid-binding protein